MPEPVIPVYDIRASSLMLPIIEQQKELSRKNADIMQQAFKTAIGDSNLEHSWNCDDKFYQNYSTVISERIRGADLALVSQYQETDGEGWKSLPARLTINSGRPVLVIPHGGRHPVKFKAVIIAWNNSREAARAVFDAVPILKNAQSVKILSVHSANDDKVIQGQNNIVLALKRHGVEVMCERVIAKERSFSETLISESGDFDADLLIMGCYGRPRLQEFIFGGVTRDILNSMPVPVLMSH